LLILVNIINININIITITIITPQDGAIICLLSNHVTAIHI